METRQIFLWVTHAKIHSKFQFLSVTAGEEGKGVEKGRVTHPEIYERLFMPCVLYNFRSCIFQGSITVEIPRKYSGIT